MYGNCLNKEAYCKSIGISIVNHDIRMSLQNDALTTMLQGIVGFSSAINNSAQGNELVVTAMNHAHKLHPLLKEWRALQKD